MPSLVPIRVYLAAPLFTQGEWLWNERFSEELRQRSFEVILPQRRAESMLAGGEPFNASLLFKANVDAIESASVIVAILDGADADSGTAWECGYAYKAGIPIIAVRTDIRAGGDDAEAATNLMLSTSSECVVVLPVAARCDLVWVADKVSAAVRRAVEGGS